MILKTLRLIFHYLAKAKWTWSLPAEKDYLLVDGNYNPFGKYIKKKDLSIFYRRGEEINILIFIKCIFKLKFSTLDYYAEYIKCVKPKLILTGFDYHSIFYKLSKKTGIKTLMLQKGKRAPTETFVSNSNNFFPKNSKNQFFVDFILVHNKTVKKFYSKKISGKIIVIGSFENNFLKINPSKQKKEVVFISNFHPDIFEKRENEDLVALHLSNLSKKNKIKFNILPRFRHNKDNLIKEIKFYKKIIKEKINFIKNKNETSYNLLTKYKYIFSTYSTLAAETLSKGGRAGYLMFKSYNNKAFEFRYGSFEGLKKKGPFWTSSDTLDLKEFERVFNFVLKTNKQTWINKSFKHIRKVIDYDYNNSKFLKILKNLK